VSADGVFDIQHVDDAMKEIPADKALKGSKASGKKPRKK